MSHSTEDAKQDIAFLRALIEDSDHTMALDGAILTAVGVVFGFVSLFYWLLFAGILHVRTVVWDQWAWMVGVLALVPVVLFLQRRFPKPSGAASRAVLAAWSGVGTGIAVAGLALGLGAWRVQQPSLVLWTFPVMLFTLYGAAWGVAFAVRRRPWFALVAGGCFAAALACGFFMGGPQQWIVLSLGLFLLVAAPGFAIVRRARSE